MRKRLKASKTSAGDQGLDEGFDEGFDDGFDAPDLPLAGSFFVTRAGLDFDAGALDGNFLAAGLFDDGFLSAGLRVILAMMGYTDTR